MDTRAARRTAEKAARDLIATRADVVGELAVAAAERAQLTDQITAATDRGQQLVTAAHAEADRLVASARDLAADSEQRYTDAHNAATAAGWSSTDLTTLGFQPSTHTGPRRRDRAPRRPEPTPKQPQHTQQEQGQPEANAAPTHD